MATTTVAGNKVKVYHLNDKKVPEGWVVDGKGQTVTDPHEGFEYTFKRKEGGITPLGGTGAMGSHKGYGLAMLAHILGGCLVGASFSPIRNRTQKDNDPNNIGHFFLALRPDVFRPEGEFETDLDAVIDELHGADRVNPDVRVKVAGEPEDEAKAKRLAGGIPIPDALDTLIKGIAERAGAQYVLTPA